MRTTRCISITLMLILGLLSVNLSVAKEPPDKADIILLDGTIIEVTDADLLVHLAMGALEDFNPRDQQTGLSDPADLGEGIEIIRYHFDNINDEYVPFDHLRYYPSPTVGPGYVYYQGPVFSATPDDGEWYRAKSQGSATVGRILRDYRSQQIDSVVLSGHTSAVTNAVWSPDSQMIATSAGNWDSTDFGVRLWSKDGTLLTTFDNVAPVGSLDWSPDGSTLALGAFNQTVQFWTTDGTLLQTIETAPRIPMSIDWSPDGTKLAVALLGGARDNTIQIWSADGELLHNLPTQYSGGKFLNVGWSPDGQYLAGGAIDYKAWTADGVEVVTHESCEFCTPAWGFAWSPDSSKWAIGNESGQVWVYGADGTLIAELSNEGNVDNLAWSPDSTMLAGGSSIWEWTGERFAQRTGMSSSRSGLAWSPDSHFIATAGENQSNVRLWDTQGEFLAILNDHTFHIWSLAWSPDGSLLASTSGDKTVRLWNMERLQAVVAAAPP